MKSLIIIILLATASTAAATESRECTVTINKQDTVYSLANASLHSLADNSTHIPLPVKEAFLSLGKTDISLIQNNESILTISGKSLSYNGTIGDNAQSFVNIEVSCK